MTKKKYSAPELEIVTLEQEDIITVSKRPVAGPTANRGEWDDNWA